jgi:hypothetical protein
VPKGWPILHDTLQDDPALEFLGFDIIDTGDELDHSCMPSPEQDHSCVTALEQPLHADGRSAKPRLPVEWIQLLRDVRHVRLALDIPPIQAS